MNELIAGNNTSSSSQQPPPLTSLPLRKRRLQTPGLERVAEGPPGSSPVPAAQRVDKRCPD